MVDEDDDGEVDEEDDRDFFISSKILAVEAFKSRPVLDLNPTVVVVASLAALLPALAAC